MKALGPMPERVAKWWRRRGGGRRGPTENVPANASFGSKWKRELALEATETKTPGEPGAFTARWSGKRDLNLPRRLMLTGRRDTRIPTTALSHSGFGAPLLRTSPQPSAPVA